MLYVVTYIVCYAIILFFYYYLIRIKWKIPYQIYKIHKKCKGIGIYDLLSFVVIFAFVIACFGSLGSWMLPVYIAKSIASGDWDSAFGLFGIFTLTSLVAFSFLDIESDEFKSEIEMYEQEEKEEENEESNK